MSRPKSSLHLQGTPPDASGTSADGRPTSSTHHGDEDEDGDEAVGVHDSVGGYAAIPSGPAAAAPVTAAPTASAAALIVRQSSPPRLAAAPSGVLDTRWSDRVPSRALIRMWQYLPIAEAAGAGALVCKRWSALLTSASSNALWERALDSDSAENWVSAGLLARVQAANGSTTNAVGGRSAVAPGAVSPQCAGGFGTAPVAAGSLLAISSTAASTPHATAAMAAGRSVPLHSMVANTGGAGNITPHGTNAMANAGTHHSRHSSLTLRTFLAPDADDDLPPLAAATAAPAAQGAGPSGGGSVSAPTSNHRNHGGVITPVTVLVAPATSLAVAVPIDASVSSAATAAVRSPTHGLIGNGALSEPFLSGAGAPAAASSSAATIDVAALIAHFKSAVRTRRRSARRPIPGTAPAVRTPSIAVAVDIPAAASGVAAPAPALIGSLGASSFTADEPEPAALAPAVQQSASRTAYLRVRAQIATAIHSALEALVRQSEKQAYKARERMLESDWWAFVSQLSRLRRVAMFGAMLLMTGLVLVVSVTHDGYLHWPDTLSRADQLWISVGIPCIGASSLVTILMTYAYARVHVRHDLYAYLADDPLTGAPTTGRTSLLWWFRATLPVCALGLLVSSCLLTAKLAADTGTNESHGAPVPSTQSFAASLSYADALGPAAMGFALLTLLLAASHVSNTLYTFLPVLWFFGSTVRAMRDRRRTAITCFFAFCTTTLVMIALKLDGSSSLGWTTTLTPVWLMTIPLTRLLFIYRRSDMERRSDQWMYTFPLFFCALVPACCFLLLLTLQLDSAMAPFRWVYLLLPLLLPLVAVPACQALLYYAVIQHHFE